ncbi:hypothetical protein Scep_028670 [Stephania cephalantha]|uniref:Uncharacterized protein n=1 Tax=Stephania cephalantha TaxID=152367 RepID=A0AAP0EHP3_9MAGN
MSLEEAMFINQSNATCTKKVSRKIAREHIKNLIMEAWKRLNKEQIENSLWPKALIDAAINFARAAQLMYQNGDGYGAIVDLLTEDSITFETDGRLNKQTTSEGLHEAFSKFGQVMSGMFLYDIE